MKYLLVFFLAVALSLCADEETYPGSYVGNIVTVTKYHVTRQCPAQFPNVTFGLWANRTDAEDFAVRAAASIVQTNEGYRAILNYYAGNYKIYSYDSNAATYTTHYFVETISVTNAPHLEPYVAP